MIKEDICKCCGQTLPPDYGFYLPAGYRIIFEIVRKAGKEGIRTDRLRQQVYGDRWDGGPDSPKIMSARIFHLNRRHLKKHKLKIEGERTGSREFGRYRIVHVV
jgi:hypothetical protein